jgi:molybdopterin converting factor small subunit
MSIIVRIPSPLRGFTNGLKTVEVKGSTVSAVLQDLNNKYPGIQERLYDQKTQRPLINIYLNNEDIRILNKEKGRYETDTSRPVKQGDQLSIIPPIAGGVGQRQPFTEN